jgi:acyl carrier protein
MGLDSVELVMEVEKYFGIQIPDPEAEKAATVQDMVDCVAKILSVTDNSTELRDSIINKIQAILLKLGLIDKLLNRSAPIFLTLSPNDKIIWKSFCKEIVLSVPKPEIKKRIPATFFDKIKNQITWGPLYEWDKITIEQFADAICAVNSSSLINSLAIKNTYEIYIAVTRITVDKIGVDEYDITPEKSFTNDLGVD